MISPLAMALIDLETHKLTVALAPLRWGANPGGMRRVCIDQNPRWYRELCARYAVHRGKKHPSTRVKRKDTLRVLRRMTAGRYTWSKYAPEIRLLAFKHYPPEPF